MSPMQLAPASFAAVIDSRPLVYIDLSQPEHDGSRRMFGLVMQHFWPHLAHGEVNVYLQDEKLFMTCECGVELMFHKLTGADET